MNLGSEKGAMGQRDLLDDNIYNIISKCFINTKRQNVAEVIVIYENGVHEKIWAFNQTRYIFDYRDFVGKTKIEAVFYCDRKSAE